MLRFLVSCEASYHFLFVVVLESWVFAAEALFQITHKPLSLWSCDSSETFYVVHKAPGFTYFLLYCLSRFLISSADPIMFGFYCFMLFQILIVFSLQDILTLLLYKYITLLFRESLSGRRKRLLSHLMRGRVLMFICLPVWLSVRRCLPQANLPLLQRELLHCARLAKQNPAQYLAQHEQLLLDTSTTSPVDSSELLLDVNENGKRRTPDR